MARTTTWRSSLWARWLGWTALYALVVYGVNVVLAFIQTSELGYHIPFLFGGSEYSVVLAVVLVLVPAVLAVVIGARFRSRWWGLGPLAALALPAAMVITLTPRPALEHDQGWPVIFAGWFVAYGALFALIGIAGVWWGKRREARKSGSTASSLTGDASP